MYLTARKASCEHAHGYGDADADVDDLRPATDMLASALVGYAGLAGALLPPLENTVTPPIAHWTTSAEPVLATLLGGVHAFAGPIVGAVLFLVIKDVIVRFTEYWLIVFGVIVVGLVMGFPEGVMSIYGKLRRRRHVPTVESRAQSTEVA